MTTPANKAQEDIKRAKMAQDKTLLFSPRSKGGEETRDQFKAFFESAAPQPELTTIADAQKMVDEQRAAEEKRKKDMTDLLEELFTEYETPSLSEPESGTGLKMGN